MVHRSHLKIMQQRLYHDLNTFYDKEIMRQKGRGKSGMTYTQKTCRDVSTQTGLELKTVDIRSVVLSGFSMTSHETEILNETFLSARMNASSKETSQEILVEIFGWVDLGTKVNKKKRTSTSKKVWTHGCHIGRLACQPLHHRGSWYCLKVQFQQQSRDEYSQSRRT